MWGNGDRSQADFENPEEGGRKGVFCGSVLPFLDRREDQTPLAYLYYLFLAATWTRISLPHLGRIGLGQTLEKTVTMDPEW